MQDGVQKNLLAYTFNDPKVELQSYFTRWQFNYKDRYSLSASFRADGSSKFGASHRYAYFPALSAKWSISEEDFMKNNTIFSNLGLRLGWGKTGNQEFPAGAADSRYQYNGAGNLQIINFANPDLKWETITAYNAGIDFGFLKGRITGTLDIFFKKTTDPLFPGTFAVPAPGGTLWQNLKGYITNKGGELGINAIVIQKDNLTWSVGGNVTYVKNKFVYPAAGSAPLVLAGQLSGKGTSATYVQAIANDQPIDVFFLRKFHGFDQNGFAVTDSVTTYSGDPNPKWVVGLNTELDYKKFSLVINLHGAYDYVIYNNTLQSVTGLGFIVNGSNISKTLIGTKENLANPVSSSTRYLYSGNYLKLGNATLRYRIGDLFKYLKNVNVTFTGYNLFNITHYPGFDPEVNTATADINTTGIPSRGIDYIGYPSVRSYTLGVNFSLY
jgi:iron complex outermembrane receptor protein